MNLTSVAQGFLNFEGESSPHNIPQWLNPGLQLPRWQKLASLHDAGVVIQQPRPPSFFILFSSMVLCRQEVGKQLGSSQVEVDQRLLHLLGRLDCRR